MYAEPKLAILPFPSNGGVPKGWGGPQNEYEIEKENVHDIRHCQNRILKIYISTRMTCRLFEHFSQISLHTKIINTIETQQQ